jgi:sterol desaturase/sphingolipid hydroxylase (fatty acid hydroxylase superfamily)
MEEEPRKNKGIKKVLKAVFWSGAGFVLGLILLMVLLLFLFLYGIDRIIS